MSRKIATAVVLFASLSIAVRADSTGDVARYNCAVGVQTIGSQYQFTDKTRLLETAEIIRDMGSNIIKFRLDPQFKEFNYAGPDPIQPKSLADLAARDPSIRTVFEMPFYYYFMWINLPFAPAEWRDADGYTQKDADAEYKEMYDLACYLLKTYNRSGKTFFLGNWEGDWLLLGSYDRADEPDPKRIPEMIKWINNRQKAVDDAKRDTPHEDVKLFYYVEVNLVEKGIRGRSCITTEVLPHTKVDYVSYSAYEIGVDYNLDTAMDRTVSFIEKKLPAKEGIDGPRVFIGEFGYKAASFGPEEQKNRSIQFMQAALKRGCPFVLYWQLYDNELVDGKYKGYWLIDNEGKKYPLFNAMTYFFAESKKYLGEKNQLPERSVFNRKARGILDDANRKN